LERKLGISQQKITSLKLQRDNLTKEKDKVEAKLKKEEE